MVPVVRVDEDADHDHVADGADHDGADEGSDARSVDADRVGGRLVVSSDDVLRCVRCGIALRLVLGSARRAGGFGWSACGWRRGKREGGRRIVARTMTSRSHHDGLGSSPCALDDARRLKTLTPSRKHPEAPGSTRKLPMHAPGMYPRGHEPARHGVSTVTPPPASSLRACAGIVRTTHANTNTSLPGGRSLLGLRPSTHRACSVGLRPFALGAVAPLLRSPAAAPLVGTAAPLARRDGCPPRPVQDRRPTALLLASYACLRCVREDDDADPIVSQMVPTTMVLMKAQTPD